MAQSGVSWTDHSINPIRARHRGTGKVGHFCEKITPGCANCYSSTMQRAGLVPRNFSTDDAAHMVPLFLDQNKLAEVRRRRKPTQYFWCDMTDLFGAWVRPSNWGSTKNCVKFQMSPSLPSGESR